MARRGQAAYSIGQLIQYMHLFLDGVSFCVLIICSFWQSIGDHLTAPAPQHAKLRTLELRNSQTFSYALRSSLNIALSSLTDGQQPTDTAVFSKQLMRFIEEPCHRIAIVMTLSRLIHFIFCQL